MKKRYTELPIAYALKESEIGVSMGEIIRWVNKWGGVSMNGQEDPHFE